jgi:hypothetical protein
MTIAGLVSVDVGVIHRVDDGLTRWDHPQLAAAYAQACNTNPLVGTRHNARAGGTALDAISARPADVMALRSGPLPPELRYVSSRSDPLVESGAEPEVPASPTA